MPLADNPADPSVHPGGDGHAEPTRVLIVELQVHSKLEAIVKARELGLVN